jgi:sortase (surface protein transpeptidase)
MIQRQQFWHASQRLRPFWPLLVLVLLTLTLTWLRPEPASSRPVARVQTQLNAKAPVIDNSPRLEIPKLGVNAKIQNVGLTKAGDMGTPTNILDVAWYKLGTKPGQKGSAVLAGHLDGPNGERGVFADLNKLTKGDTIIFKQNGAKSTFVVRRTVVYDQLAHPREVFFSNSGAHLNLITCTGSWDEGTDRYAQRLVVFSDLK